MNSLLTATRLERKLPGVIDTLQIYHDLSGILGQPAAQRIAELIGGVYRDLEQAAPKEGLQEVRQVLQQLAQAQEHTEQQLGSLARRVEELAKAQQRTEQRVEELAQAQQRTEQRVEELAQAQHRTEQRVEELAQAQQRTEQQLGSLARRVEELAQAQQRTEQTMLAGFRDLNRRFDVLGARWGDDAEEAFRQGLIEALRGLGYTVEHFRGQDPQGFINRSPRSFDLDVLVRNDELVVAEIKSSASGADVTEFHRCVLLYEEQTGRRASKRILVAVTIQNAARERARELGIIVATGFEPVTGEG